MAATSISVKAPEGIRARLLWDPQLTPHDKRRLLADHYFSDETTTRRREQTEYIIRPHERVGSVTHDRGNSDGSVPHIQFDRGDRHVRLDG